MKKMLLRDSLLVLPILLFTAIWLILTLGFHIDLAPGADYLTSFYRNLLLPLFLIGLGQLVYAVILIIDIWRTDRFDTKKKLLYSVVIWFAVQMLYVLVYIVRMAWLSNGKHNGNTVS